MWQHHPDKAEEANRPAAEAKFKEVRTQPTAAPRLAPFYDQRTSPPSKQPPSYTISSSSAQHTPSNSRPPPPPPPTPTPPIQNQVKAAYESILRRQAGYNVPPPNSPPNAAYAEAYWHANSRDGRVPWGRFGGYETELQFYRWGCVGVGVGVVGRGVQGSGGVYKPISKPISYGRRFFALNCRGPPTRQSARAAAKGGRNSLLVLTLTGLVAIPIITTCVMLLQGWVGVAAFCFDARCLYKCCVRLVLP